MRKTQENNHEKTFGPPKYPREKILDPEIPTRKNFGPTKYPREKSGPTKYLGEKTLDPRNTHEKKFRTHEITTRKNFGPTKVRWHNGTKP